MLSTLFSIIVTALAWIALIAYLCWAIWVLYRLIVKPGKNGTLPWLYILIGFVVATQVVGV